MSERPRSIARLARIASRHLARHARWAHPAAAVVLGLVACLAFGAYRRGSFPLDDTYIHLDYGLDFSFRTVFSFDGVARDTGTSSWIWTALCILVVQLGLPEYATLTTIAVLTFSGLLWLTMDTTARALPAATPARGVWPYAAALLLTLNGNVLWLSLTGMETSFSVLLLVATVQRALLGRGMTPLVGLMALGVVWTRVEGVAWLAALALVMAATGRGRRGAWIGWLFPAAGLVVYFAYNRAVGGAWLPTSALGKTATFVQSGHDLAAELRFVANVGRDYILPVLRGWVFQLGVACAALVVCAIDGAAALLRRSPRARVALGPGRAAVLILFAGALGHTLVNLVSFRTTYHHLRYFAPVLFLAGALSLPLALAAADAIVRRMRRPRARRAVRCAAAAAIGLGAAWTAWRGASDLRYWVSLYRKNAAQLAAVHMAVGRYLRAEAPRGTRSVASFDIGALRWTSGLKVVDLAGTSDAHALAYQRQRRPAALVRDTHADLYVSVENGFDAIPAADPRVGFTLTHLRTWQYREYRDPTPPHSKRMVLYKVNHCGEPGLFREPRGGLLDFTTAASEGTRQGDAFAGLLPVRRVPGLRVERGRGPFLSSFTVAAGERATGRFETAPMRVEGDWLSFLIAGNHQPAKLRIELLRGGEVIETWTGYDTDSFLEVTHPLAGLAGEEISLAVVDESPRGHILLDEVQQFAWREGVSAPCPAEPAGGGP